MKNFEEKALIDLSIICGGKPKVTGTVEATVNWQGWFDGSFWGNLFDGDKSTRPTINEFDDTSVSGSISN